MFYSGSYWPHLYPGQHACSGHTKVQIGNHLCCGRLVYLWRPTTRKVICQTEQQSVNSQLFKGKKLMNIIH